MQNLFVQELDGNLVLTVPGYILIACVIFAALMLAAKLGSKGRRFNVRTLVFSAVAISVAMVLSAVKLFHMPMGGSITLASMLFVTLVGYWYGPAAGFMSAVAYGLLQFAFNPYILNLGQVLVDYVFAFGALGISGFFSKKKNGLIWGYLAAVTGRLFFSILSGMIFFGEYAESSLAEFNISVPVGLAPLIYSTLYNGAYIYGEALITVVILLLPPVAAALAVVKRTAVGQGGFQ